MKRLTIIGLAALGLGISGSAFGDDSNSTSVTSPSLGSLIYGELIELSGVVAAEAEVFNDFETDGGVAWAVRQRGAGLADEGCNAPRGVAIVAGNVEGFTNYASLYEGSFSADVDAMNLPAGLYCFALNYPGAGRDFVDFYIVDEYAKAGGRYYLDEVGLGTDAIKGNSPTHAMEGVVGMAGGEGLVGSIRVNYRQLKEYKTFIPNDLSLGSAAGIGVTDGKARAEITAEDATYSGNTPTPQTVIILLDKDASEDFSRGAAIVRYNGDPSMSYYELDRSSGTTGADSWVRPQRGNVEVGVRPTN